MSIETAIKQAFTDRYGRFNSAAVADLKNSGLSDETIVRAGLKLYSNDNEALKKELGFNTINGIPIADQTSLIDIPYTNEEGHREYSRYKMIPQLDADTKYLHPLRTPSRPYIPQIVHEAKSKSSQPIWITEGEKKALKVCQEGRPCIGLAGVWGFKAGQNSKLSEDDKQLWSELKRFQWQGRSVYMGFDSDVYTNPQVRYALFELAIKLLALGAIVKFPCWNRGKGIDDYLVSEENPKEAIQLLERNAKDIAGIVDPAYQKEIIRALSVISLSPVIFEQLTASLAKSLKVSTKAVKQQITVIKNSENGQLDQFFNRFALIYPTKFIFDTKEKISIEAAALALAYPDHFEMWRKSPAKKQTRAEKIVFKPQGCADDEFNLFDGLALQSQYGSCNKILALAKHLTNYDPGLFHWLMCWLAYPLKHIGAKMRTCVVVHGGQGVGKNLFFELYGRLYEKYYSYVTQDTLNEKYTQWASGKLFILCDEVLANRTKGEKKNLLKSYVTQDAIGIRLMYQERRIEENHCNFVFLSNESLPILIDQDDRRHTIIQCQTPLDRAFYNQVVEEINNGGREAFTDYLLNYDSGNFNEYSPCFETDAKKDLAAQCEEGFDSFLKQWQAGNTDLPFCSCTTDDLFHACRLWITHNNEYMHGGKTSFAIRVKTLIERNILKDCIQARFTCQKKQYRGLVVDKIPEDFVCESQFRDLNDELASFFKSKLAKFVEKLGNLKP